MRVAARHAGLFAAMVVALPVAAADPPIDLTSLLAKVGDRVEAYYTRAQTIMCLETVRLQRLASDFSPDGFARQLVFDLRVSWDPSADGTTAPEANVLRQLRTVNGRPPHTGDLPECLDPKPISIDPLLFLLAKHQPEYTFWYKGSSDIAGHRAVKVAYVPSHPGPPEINWQDTCVSISLPSRTSGYVWVDTVSGDVLRVDEHMQGPHEIEVPREARRGGGSPWLTFERSDVSIRYKLVTFHDPDETIVLPESIDSTSIARGSRLRTTRTFSGYRRFVTDAKIVQ